jgi:predicted metal-dependent hydrolase
MRARDALGRPVPAGSPAAVEPVSEEALPPLEAVALARALMAQGRAFSAHEVFEASWKAAPAGERDLWQGLAQVCVGLTHLQRGNATGARTLLLRAAMRLEGLPAAYGVDVPQVRLDALALAEAGGGTVRL